MPNIKNSYNKKYFTDDRKIKILLETGITFPHSHDFIEIVYFDDGNGFHNIDGTEYPVSGGDIYILSSNTKHYYYSDSQDDNMSGLIVYDCIFDESMFENEISSIDNFIPEFVEKFMAVKLDSSKKFYYAKSGLSFSFRSFLIKMFDEFNKKENGYLELLKANIIELMIRIIRMATNKSKYEYNDDHDFIVKAIITYMNNNPKKNIYVRDVSKLTNFSVSHINRIFKEKMGMTIVKYANKCRMGFIGSILKGTDLSIEKIMEEAGYNDKKRFYEMFKRQYSCTPGEFRKMFK